MTAARLRAAFFVLQNEAGNLYIYEIFLSLHINTYYDTQNPVNHITFMKRLFPIFLTALVCVALVACADHDDPQLEPIDTTQVKITADITQSPDSPWLNSTQEMSLSVSDINMAAPKGVVLRSISLLCNNGVVTHLIDDKPYSGEPLEFKVPLANLQGRLNFSLRGNLIKKDSRDAEVIIADNIQKIVFSEEPKLECEGMLIVTVKSMSTTGEEYSRSFEVKSGDDFTIAIPRDELYWTPTSGTASTIDVTLGSGALAWSPNTTFECKIVKMALGHNTDAEPTLKLTLPNTPGALDAEKLQLYVMTSYFGTWENITITPYNLISVFGIVER